MKRLLFLLIVICSTISSWGESSHQYSNGILSGFCMLDSMISKPAAWEATNRWIATQMDSKDAHIVYENVNEGTLIIKGRYKDTNNGMFCVRYDFIIPYVSYELEINISDGSYCAKYNKINYEPIVGYGDVPYGLGILQQRILNEMNEIKGIMLDKGEVWLIDNDFVNKGNSLNTKIKEAKIKKEDKSLSKKERKQFKKYYEENNGREGIYHNVKMAAHRLVFDTLLSDGNLQSIIQSILSKSEK